jgi:hypothetical protein
VILDVRWAVVGFLSSATLALPWLTRLRLDLPDPRAPRDFHVTSGADSGPGSLRAGIMAANTADGPARLRLPAARLTVETALPPLVNPHGVLVEGTDGTEIDGAAIVEGPLLDVIAPGSRLRRFALRHAGEEGLRVRAPRVEVENVSFASCRTGLRVLGSADDVAVTRSRFDENEVGVQIDGGAARTRLQDNAFRGHTRAGVWAVAPAPVPPPGLVARKNRFDADGIGIAALNVPARIEDNDIARARNAGLLVSGRENVLRHNRARGGRAYGICAVASDATLIEGNETDGNQAAGLLVRDAHNTVVRANRVYANGFGIVVLFGDARRPSTLTGNAIWNQRFDGVYVIGGSPILAGNEIRVNGGAGMRIDDFRDRHGRERRSEPLLRDNAVDRNGSDETRRGTYIEPPLREE